MRWRQRNVKSPSISVKIDLDGLDALDETIEKLRQVRRELCAHQTHLPEWDWDRQKAIYTCGICGTRAEVPIENGESATMPIGWENWSS